MGGVKVVETQGLTKRYGTGIVAVDGLDLNVYRGEVYGFLALRRCFHGDIRVAVKDQGRHRLIE